MIIISGNFDDVIYCRSFLLDFYLNLFPIYIFEAQEEGKKRVRKSLCKNEQTWRENDDCEIVLGNFEEIMRSQHNMYLKYILQDIKKD